MIQTFNSAIYAVATTTPEVTLTVSAGTGRKAIVCVCYENETTTVTAALFNSATFNTQTTVDAVSPVARTVWLRWDIGNEVPSGTYTVSLTLSAAQTCTVGGWVVSGRAAGSYEATAFSEGTSSQINVTPAVTIPATAGDDVFAVYVNTSDVPTLQFTAGVTGRGSNNETGYTTLFGDAENVTAGTYTVGAGNVSGNDGAKLLVVFTYAAATSTASLAGINTGLLY